MKKIQLKYLLSSIGVFSLVFFYFGFIGSEVYAIDTESIPYEKGDDVQIISDKIGLLIETHKELTLQIDKGEITQEDAEEEWKILVDTLRREKEERFTHRFQGINTRAKILKALHPGYVDWVAQDIEEIKNRELHYRQLRAEVRNMLQNGEITRAEARERHKEFIVFHNRRAGKKIEEFSLFKKVID